MPAVTVRAVQSRRDRKRFIDFQYEHYRGNEAFVPPLRMDQEHTLDPKKNAFFEHGKMQLFIAEDATGAVVGRIAAIVNGMHLRKYDDGNGFFGFFECVEDYDTARALFDAAAGWLRDQGLHGMRGPTNPTMNDVAGLLVDGFDRQPSLLMPYNPAYYQDFLLRYGFERVMTMWAYYVHKKYVKTEKLRRGVEIVKRRNPGIRLRQLDMKRFDDEAQIVLDIYNDAWSNNWGHVPMTPNEFKKLAKDMKQIVDPRMVFLLEDEGRPVGFSISLPNLNLALRHIPNGRLLPLGLPKLLAYSSFGGVYEVRMPLMGIRKEYHGRGLDSILVYETIVQGPRIGYDACEMSWVLDVNHVLRNSLVSMGGVIDKEYAMFEKRLETE